MAAPTPSPSPLDFAPSPALAARIIADLAEPEATLASVAELHNISRATLTLWLNTADARARMLEIERGSAAHIRMTASLHLSTAIDTLVHILNDYRRSRNASSLSSSATPNPTDGPAVHPTGVLPLLPLAAALKADANSTRKAETARKAAYTLHRLCRYTPLTEEQIEADVKRHLQVQLRRAQLHNSQLHNSQLGNAHFQRAERLATQPPLPRHAQPEPPRSQHSQSNQSQPIQSRQAQPTPTPTSPAPPAHFTPAPHPTPFQPSTTKSTPSKPARASPASLLGAAGIAHRSPRALDPPLILAADNSP